MLLNTKFVTSDEVEALRPEQFEPQATAEELYVQTQEELIGESYGPVTYGTRS